MGVAAESDWSAPLERHRSRREQAVPTITVLVGPQRSPEWLWRRWQRPAPALVVTAARGTEVLEQWLGRGAAREEIQRALLDVVAAVIGIPRSDLGGVLAGRSPAQLETLALRAAAHADVDVDWMRHALALPCSNGLVGAEIPASLGKLLALAGQLPPLLVRPTGATPALRDVVDTLYRISEEAPRAEVALALDEQALRLLRSGAPPRVIASLMEGLVMLRPRESLGESRAAGAHAIEYDAAQFARSQAELSLFERLERRPHTRGLFRLNRVVTGGEPARAMEIDLLCEPLALAVEVDGYHHFRDAEAYRRDRRKDVRLQELGYLVVRVLASDIEAAPEHVLETIDRAVESRRRRSP